MHRHGDLSTLFRSPETEARPTGRAEVGARETADASAGDLPIVQGVVLQALTRSPAALPPATGLPAAALPFASEPPWAPVSRDIAATPTSTPPRGMPVRPGGMSERASVPEPVSIPEPTSASADSADTSITDAVWRRLQTIFHRHQEQQATSPAGVSPSAAYTPASDQPTADVQREPTLGGPTLPLPQTRPRSPSIVEVAAPQKAAAAPVAPAPSPTGGAIQEPPARPSELPTPPPMAEPEASRDSERGLVAIRLPEAAAVTPPLPTDALQLELDDQAKGPTTEAGSSLPFSTQGDSRVEPAEAPTIPAARSSKSLPAEPPEGTQPTPQTGGQEIARTPHPPQQTAPQSPRAPVALAPSETVVSLPSEEPPHVPEATSQPLPLQAVWAVERVTRTSTEPGAGPPPSRPPAPLPSAAPEAGPMDTVQRVLDSVESAQPTASSIELIPPRRPRPPEDRRRARGSKLAAPPARTETAPPQTIQRSLEEAQPARAHPVETAIGPLPPDLWELIGEPVPEESPAATETQPLPEEDRDILQIRVRQSPPPSPLPMATESAPPTPGDVQREVEQTEMPAPTSTTQARVEAESPAGGAASELDLDDLARKVYAEIRRKLSVEWERFRSRKG